jgi:hypothetical protein
MEDTRNVRTVLVRNSEENSLLKKLRSRRKDNIKMGVSEVELGWIGFVGPTILTADAVSSTPQLSVLTTYQGRTAFDVVRLSPYSLRTGLARGGSSVGDRLPLMILGPRGTTFLTQNYRKIVSEIASLQTVLYSIKRRQVTILTFSLYNTTRVFVVSRRGNPTNGYIDDSPLLESLPQTRKDC